MHHAHASFFKNYAAVQNLQNQFEYISNFCFALFSKAKTLRSLGCYIASFV